MATLSIPSSSPNLSPLTNASEAQTHRAKADGEAQRRAEVAQTSKLSTSDTDTVTLSSAAKAGSRPSAASAPSTLSDAEAQSQAVSLRSLLGGQSLSASAAQNQSILSLIR